MGLSLNRRLFRTTSLAGLATLLAGDLFSRERPRGRAPAERPLGDDEVEPRRDRDLDPESVSPSEESLGNPSGSPPAPRQRLFPDPHPNVRATLTTAGAQGRPSVCHDFLSRLLRRLRLLGAAGAR